MCRHYSSILQVYFKYTASAVIEVQTWITVTEFHFSLLLVEVHNLWSQNALSNGRNQYHTSTCTVYMFMQTKFIQLSQKFKIGKLNNIMVCVNVLERIKYIFQFSDLILTKHWAESLSRSINQSINQSISQPVSQSIRQPIDQSVNQSIN